MATGNERKMRKVGLGGYGKNGNAWGYGYGFGGMDNERRGRCLMGMRGFREKWAYGFSSE